MQKQHYHQMRYAPLLMYAAAIEPRAIAGTFLCRIHWEIKETQDRLKAYSFWFSVKWWLSTNGVNSPLGNAVAAAEAVAAAAVHALCFRYVIFIRRFVHLFVWLSFLLSLSWGDPDRQATRLKRRSCQRQQQHHHQHEQLQQQQEQMK